MDRKDLIVACAQDILIGACMWNVKHGPAKAIETNKLGFCTVKLPS